MHELPVTKSIVNISCEEAEKHKVHKVKEIRIKIGELTGLVPDSIQYYFDIISKGTKVEGALLDIEKLPIKILCNSCGNNFKASKHDFQCTRCSSRDIKIEGGNEFYIESLEVE